jgi:hypothetical protein
MSNRFHSKYHRTNHHTYGSDSIYGTPSNPDSGHDPIASPDHPFKGDFVLRGGLSASVPPTSAYAGAFMGNLLLTGNFIVEDDVININYPYNIVGINLDPTYPINYRTIGDFDFVVNKNAYFLRNITTPTLSTEYIRVAIKDNSFNFPVHVLDHENLSSYFVINNEGKVGINLANNINFENFNFKVNNSCLFNVLGEKFNVRGDTEINHDVNGFVTRLGTNMLAGDVTLGREEFVRLTGQKVLSANGDVVFTRNFYLSGNSVLGSDGNDTITANAKIASHLVPHLDKTHDLGNNALAWRDLYGRSAFFQDNLQVDDNTILGSSNTDLLSVNARINTHLIPFQDKACDLGSPDLAWRTLYFGNLSGIDGIFSRNLQITGNTTINGNTIIGLNEATNTVRFNSRVNSDFTPTTPSTFNLGTALNNWNNVFFRTLSGTSGNFSGNLTVQGDLSVLGNTSQLDTLVNVTSSMSITNDGTITALVVRQNGTTDIASFLDDGVNRLIIKNGGFVGVNTENPTDRLTVNGNISSNSNIILGNQLIFPGNNILSVNASNNLTTNQNLHILGNTILGNEITDTVTFTSRLISDILPNTDNSRQLGNSSLRWSHVNALSGIFQGVEVENISDSATNTKLALNKASADIIYKNFEDNIIINNFIISSTVYASASINGPGSPTFNINIYASSGKDKWFEIIFVYYIRSGSASGNTVIDTNFFSSNINLINNLPYSIRDEWVVHTDTLPTTTGSAAINSSFIQGVVAIGNFGTSTNTQTQRTITVAQNNFLVLKRILMLKTTNDSIINDDLTIAPYFKYTSGQAYDLLRTSYITRRKMI